MQESEGSAPISMEGFLSSVPPGRTVRMEFLFRKDGNNWPQLLTPEILIYCSNEKCQGERYFSSADYAPHVQDKGYQTTFLRYKCKNCGQSMKIFAIMYEWDGNLLSGSAYKYGEYPPFGPHTPARVITLIGPDKDLFLSGRRCENQGLGIGAYTYYRRVVENQWSRLIDNVVKVAERIGAETALIENLKKVKNETQFSKAIDENKEIIPQVLLVENHNPLFLLHSALSSGVHAKTDEACLELAVHIRIVLTELAERLGQALKDHSGLKEAVSKLLKSHKEKKEK